MSQITELEKYFDILTADNSLYPAEHPLADDKERFLLYVNLKVHMQNLVAGLDKISTSLDSYNNYSSLISQLSTSFKQILQMENADVDFCIRSIAVDSVLHNQGDIKSGGDALASVITKMVGLFFENSDDVTKIATDIIQDLKNNHQSNSNKKEDEELKINSLYILEVYNEIENILKQAKSGIIAKDKKMIEVLRQMKMGVGKEMLDLAMQKTILPPKKKSISSILAKGKSDFKDVEKKR
jgi:hypothetical protein